MDLDLLRIAGRIAGIAGVALVVLLLIFRDVIRKRIFTRLTSRQSFALLVVIVSFTFIVSIVGIVAWVYIPSPRTPRDWEAPPESTYISIGVGDGRTFEEITQLIAREQNVTITFDPNCYASLCRAKIDGGHVSANSTEEFLRQLGLRIKGPIPNYRILSISQVRYEIVCN